MKHVVKRHGRAEFYDSKKIYASVYASVLAARESDETAELIAQRIATDLDAWMADKHEVTAHDVRSQVTKALTILHPRAGIIYKHHRILW